jgi:hypothetical protein
VSKRKKFALVLIPIFIWSAAKSTLELRRALKGDWGKDVADLGFWKKFWNNIVFFVFLLVFYSTLYFPLKVAELYEDHKLEKAMDDKEIDW